MKSPLGAAIAARRKPEMPEMEAPAESSTPMMGEGENKIAEFLAAMSDDDKMMLFEALKSEMEDTGESEESAEMPEQAAPGLTDERGQLKPTAGEQSALAEEDEGPMNPNENSFMRHARRNVAKLTKQGKL